MTGMVTVSKAGYVDACDHGVTFGSAAPDSQKETVNPVAMVYELVTTSLGIGSDLTRLGDTCRVRPRNKASCV